MSEKKHIVIIDYGVGNLWSLRKALSLYADVEVTEERERIAQAAAIVLPGVGAFHAGMEGLRVRGLIEPLKEAAAKGVPILGICLGAQLLLARGHEFGEQEGLGLIEGDVVPFEGLSPGTEVPAIGWQSVEPGEGGTAQNLFSGIENRYFYFAHSYELVPKDSAVILATTTYGKKEYCAMLGVGSIVGTQFHPEKSGPSGLRLLKNFVDSIA